MSPRVTRGLNNVQWFSLSPILYRTYGWKWSFFPRTTNLWNSLPNQCFPENYTIICLRRDVVPTLFLNGVNFDVIGGSPNVSTSLYLLIYPKKRNYVLIINENIYKPYYTTCKILFLSCNIALTLIINKINILKVILSELE